MAAMAAVAAVVSMSAELDKSMMPVIFEMPIELTDADLDAVSGGGKDGKGRSGRGGNAIAIFAGEAIAGTDGDGTGGGVAIDVDRNADGRVVVEVVRL
jgi:hypothetical protein